MLKFNRLPQGYQELEWIESDSASCIDTGVINKNTNSYDIEFSIGDTGASRNYIIGGASATGGTVDRTQMSYSATAFVGWGDGWENSIYLSVDTNKHTLHLDTNGFEVDGTSIYTPSSTEFADRTIRSYLFAMVYGNNLDNTSNNFSYQVKIYSCQIYDNGTLIRNYLPAKRTSDNEIGLYDLVNKQFYTNQGTGSFTGGSAVSVQPTDIHYKQSINQWDEEWEVGALISNGSVDSSLTTRRTTSFIEVKPNTPYRLCCVYASAYSGRYAYYDANKNLLYFNDAGIPYEEPVFTTPANCKYVRITIGAAYGTTYNHDISINFPSSVTTYVPYEVELTKVYIISKINQWDEEWELGGIDANGNLQTADDRIRSKNHILVKPNTIYYAKAPENIYVHAYDNNNNWLGMIVGGYKNVTFTTPNNCSYILFRMITTYGTTYNNDISINYPATITTYTPYKALVWATTNNQTPFAEKTLDGVRNGLHKLNKLVGCKVVKNQRFNYVGKENTTSNQVTITNNNDGSFTVNGTADGGDAIFYITRNMGIEANHIYFIKGCPAGGSDSTYRLFLSPSVSDNVSEYGNGVIATFTVNDTTYLTPRVKNGATVNNLVFRPIFVDLTKRYGSNDVVNAIIGSDSSQYVSRLLAFDSNILTDTDYDTGSFSLCKSAKLKTIDVDLTEHSYTLPNIDLNGILKVVDGKVVADGDELLPSGSGNSKRYGIVDLGSLEWTSASYGGVAGFYSQGIKTLAKSDSKCICIKFVYQSNDNTFNDNGKDLEIIINSYSSIKIKANSYGNDANAFKTAMSGVYLIYELATPTSLSANSFTDTFYGEQNGTIEFLDENDNILDGLQGNSINLIS